MINLFTRKANQRGFTLIELLVVVSIIGLLASIVVVSLGGARTQSRDVKRKADLTQIQTAMELCYNDFGCGLGTAINDYPVGANPADSDTCAELLTVNSNALAKYLGVMPKDPNTGATDYACFSSAQSYCLSADLEEVTGAVAGSFIRYSDTGKNESATAHCADAASS